MNGILLINKEKDLTSRDVVNYVATKLNTRKIGHTGTLDPMAQGVLVLCVGEATKVVDLITSLEKEYIAEVTLGIETDTLDITGQILKEEVVEVTKEEIVNALNSFQVKYSQEVPIYSAVKVNGRKLYEYARNNEEVVLPKREVEIKEIQLLDEPYIKDNHLTFKFKCLVSKGTYIRSLIRDICQKLNTVGTMSSLIRTKQGKFTINQCIKKEEVSKDKLISVLDILDIPKYEVDEYLKEKISHGQILENRYDSDKMVFTCHNQLLAIYQIYSKDYTKIKPYRMFGGEK